jgi:peptide/nickel transport system permease protein
MLVTFSIARLIPGDPCTALLGEKATKEVCDRFMEENGYNDPMATQFFRYMNEVLHGDFGDSIRYSRSVGEILIERLPTTIELGLASIIIAIIIGIPLGVISAIKRNSIVDVGVMVFANIGISMPVYWLGLMLAYLFAIVLKGTPLWLPPSGRLTAGILPVPFYEVFGWELAEGTFKLAAAQFFSNMLILNSLITKEWAVLKDVVIHLILPSLALSTIPMAIIARMTRSAMLETLRQDYIRTARAKGLREFLVIFKHSFRNALLPVVTIIGLQFGTIFAGAVLTETIFSIAGVGRMLYDSITARDYPIMQAFTLVIAAGYVLVNLIVDLSYVIIDPRIKLS